MTCITIARSVLKDAIAKMVPVLDTRALSLPITKAILFDAQPGERLVLSGTDYDAYLRITVAAAVVGIGCRILLSGQRLKEIAAHLPDSPLVTIELTPTRAVVMAGRARFELASVTHVDEFPVMPDMGDNGPSVPAKSFVETITRCAPFASTAPSRASLGCVCLENGLAVALDGAFMATMPTEPIGGPYLLHAQSIPVLTRLFGQYNDTLSITADANRMQLSGDSAVLQIRLVDGPYAAYARLLAAESPTRHVLVNRGQLLASVARVALVATDAAHRITMAVDSVLTISVETTDGERGMDAVEIVERGGDPAPMAWAINATKVLLALRTLTDEVVKISMQSPKHAIVFRDAVTPTGATILLQPLS